MESFRPSPHEPTPVYHPWADVWDAPFVLGNYIVRHWRGHLSLPVSYWINGWLLRIGYVSGLISILPSITSVTSAIGPLILIALGFAMQVWQLIGIWRSACMHTERGGRKIWAFLAQIGVIVGWGNFIKGVFELFGLPGN